MRLAAIPEVPYLDVVAARNDTGDRLTLFCVNRHLTLDINAHVSIAGFAPAADGSVQTLFASRIDDQNDDVHPEEVIPLTSQVKLQGAKLDYTFRHESVTVIEVRKESQFPSWVEPATTVFAEGH